MEIKPRPLGIMTAASSSAGALDSSSLIVSGIVGGFSGLTVGATYYTTTSGKLVSNKVVESSGPSLAAYTYITDMDTKTIVSADSEIGIAITSTSILLRVKA